MTYEKPKQRKGYALTSVWWNREGRVIRTAYERIGKAAQPDIEPDAPRQRRGIIEAETASKRAREPDLFGS